MSSPPPPPHILYAGVKFLSCFGGNDYFCSHRKGGYILGEAFAWGERLFSTFFFFFFWFCGLLLKITSAAKRFLAKVALDVQLMFFFFVFFLKKKCFVHEISRFLCFCKIHRFENLWWHRRHCYIMEVTLFWILNTINEFCNISNIFLAQCWGL